MILAVIGTKIFSDYSLLKNELNGITGIDLIVSGGAIGAYFLAIKYAKTHCIPFIEFLPNFKDFGSKAKHRRN